MSLAFVLGAETLSEHQTIAEGANRVVWLEALGEPWDEHGRDRALESDSIITSYITNAFPTEPSQAQFTIEKL